MRRPPTSSSASQALLSSAPAVRRPPASGLSRRRLLGAAPLLVAALAGLGLGCKDSKPSGSAGASTPNAPASSEIVVGHYGSLTGNTAHFGQDTDKAIRLAIDEVNAAGGVLGKKVRLVTLDDRGDSAEAANAVTRLIDVEKVVTIIGEV